EAVEILPRMALNFVDECGRGGLRGLGKKSPGALESFANDLRHLGLRVGHKVAARLIEFGGKFAGDVGSPVAQLIPNLFAYSLRGVLGLRQRAFLVPFGGLDQVV